MTPARELIVKHRLSDPAGASEITSLPLAQAILALPARYLRVLTKPSVATFAEEMGKASWSTVWVQLIGLGIIAALLDILGSLLSPLSFAVLRPLVMASDLSPLIILPLTFFITMGIAYGIAKAFAGRGTFLAQSYIALLPYVPLTILGRLAVSLRLFAPIPRFPLPSRPMLSHPRSSSLRRLAWSWRH